MYQILLQNACKALDAPKDPGDDGEEELLVRTAPLGADVPNLTIHDSLQICFCGV